MGLHAEEDEVGRGTSQAALQVGAAPNLLSLCVEAIEGLHRLLKELPLNLEGERDRESDQGQPPQSVYSHRLGVAVVGPHRGEAAHRQDQRGCRCPQSKRALDWLSGDLGFSPDLAVN